jgi:hypothetical protein
VIFHSYVNVYQRLPPVFQDPKLAHSTSPWSPCRRCLWSTGQLRQERGNVSEGLKAALSADAGGAFSVCAGSLELKAS